MVVFPSRFLNAKAISFKSHTLGIKTDAGTGGVLFRSLFYNEVAGLMSTTLSKMRFQHRCFPVNFAKFLRTPTLKNICEQQLLKRCTFTNHSRAVKKYTKLKIYKYITSVPDFLFPQNVSLIPRLSPRTIQRKEATEPSANKSVSFYIIYCLKIDVINFIYVV